MIRLATALLFAPILYAQPFVPITGSPSIITTVAGTDWVFPGNGKPALAAPLGRVSDAAVDAAGNLYFVDVDNHMVMKLNADGGVQVVAGNGIPGFSGDGGPAVRASITGGGLAVDAAGSIYLADAGNSRIRRITPDGIIRTIAGAQTCKLDFLHFVCYGGDGGPASQALLTSPTSIAVDSSGAIFFADPNTQRVRKVAANGVISTVAGTGSAGYSGDNGAAISAQLSSPVAVAFDASSNLYILERSNHRVRKVSPAGIITTYAGNGSDQYGGDSGPALAAAIGYASRMTIDAAGNLYLADGANQRIRRIDRSGTITLVAGNGSTGYEGDGGPALKASFSLDGFNAGGLAVDNAGNIYLGDFANLRVRLLSSSGIVRTVAGNGQYGFSGDGGSAVRATFNSPAAVATDAAGSVYLADGPGHRVRRIGADLQITTVAGNGLPGYSGDGGPATEASLNNPHHLAVDFAGNLYIADDSNHIRRVTPDGIITTYAGNGKLDDDFEELSGPALQAAIFATGLAVDAAGVLYVAEQWWIRKISPDGIISMVAGNGDDNATGDGGPALDAGLTAYALALDPNGNLYFADLFNERVRRIAPNGIITTIAGNGGLQLKGNGDGDGGPATAAFVNFPSGIAADSRGNVYFIDGGGSNIPGYQGERIRVITPFGIVQAFAGSGGKGYAGDGGPSEQAQFSGLKALAVDAGGNLYAADSGNRRLRMVPAARPTLNTDVGLVSFVARSGGAPPAAQHITVVTSVPLVPFDANITTLDGAAWLSVSVSRGVTPLLLDVTVNPAQLAVGTYRGAITISAPLAVPSQTTVLVLLQVDAPLPPRFNTDRTNISFTFPRGSYSSSQAVTLFNAGSGSLTFNVAAITDNGKSQNWLKVTPAAGAVAPAVPVPLTITADSSGLAAGTYSGRILISSPPGVIPRDAAGVTIGVNMTISARPLSILLSQTGLSFTSVAQGGLVPPQSFGVLSLGTGTAPFTVETSTLTGDDWLRTALPTAAPGSTPIVNIGVDASRLAPDRYYGLVKVRAPGAANTPQVATVFLDVLASGSDLGALLSPAELVFTVTQGESSPGAAEVLVYNPTGSEKSFHAAQHFLGFAGTLVIFGPGVDSIFTILPRDGVVAPNQPFRLLIQPDVNGLSLATYRGALTLQFNDGRVRTLTITVIVTPATGTKGARAAAGDCTPTVLVPTLISMGNEFSLPAGWPQAIQADVRDDCGATFDSGSVVAEFSNGDPPLSLLPLGGGRWDSTWKTASTRSAVTVTVRAQDRSGLVRGSAQVSGGLGDSQLPPRISPNGISSLADSQPVQTVAPGSVISIVGDRLATGQAMYSGPAASPQLAGATVLLNDRPMPLLSASGGQIDAIVPFGIEVDTSHQILVQRGTTYASPLPIIVAAAQPAIYRSAGTQARVINASGQTIDAQHPASAADIITLYCTGLGEVSPVVPDGYAGPPSPGAIASAAVTMTIGGVAAPISYAGLAPGQVGMYQVIARVPAGVGGNVPVQLTVQTNPPQISTPATISIR